MWTPEDVTFAQDKSKDYNFLETTASYTTTTAWSI